MTTFGITDTTNAFWDEIGAGNAIMQKVTLPAAGTINSLSIYAQSKGVANQTFRLSLYADDGANLMGVCQGTTVEHTITTAETSAEWHAVAFSSPPSCAAGDYWIMLWATTTSNGAQFNRCANSGSAAWKDGEVYSSSGNPTSPMTGEATWNVTLSMQGDYTATPTGFTGLTVTRPLNG